MRNIGVFFLLFFASLLNATAQQAHINLDWDPQRNSDGRHAQYVGLNNLDLFASIGILSAAIPVDQTPSLNDPDINSRLVYLFVGAGTHETRPGARHEVLHNDLLKLNVKHEYYIGSRGAHDLITWRHLLYYRFYPNLFRNLTIK